MNGVIVEVSLPNGRKLRNGQRFYVPKRGWFAFRSVVADRLDCIRLKTGGTYLIRPSDVTTIEPLAAWRGRVERP